MWPRVYYSLLFLTCRFPISRTDEESVGGRSESLGELLFQWHSFFQKAFGDGNMSCFSHHLVWIHTSHLRVQGKGGCQYHLTQSFPGSAAIYLPAHEKLLLKSELQASSMKKFVKRIEFRKIKMWSFNIAVADTCQGDKRNILDSKNSANTMKHYF